MKNYNEMANDVLRRIGEHETEQRKRRKTISRIVTPLCCFCLVALLGFGMWQGGMFNVIPPITDNPGINSEQDGAAKGNGTENDVLSNDDHTGALPNYTGVIDDTSKPDNMITLISSYGTDNPPITTIPKNGTVQLSASLTNAIEHYGDDVKYRVVFELYRDEQLWDIDIKNDNNLFKAEMERLYELGYTPVMEAHSENWGENEKFSLGVHASAEELENFIANTSYGYNVYLYDEIYV